MGRNEEEWKDSARTTNMLKPVVERQLLLPAVLAAVFNHKTRSMNASLAGSDLRITVLVAKLVCLFFFSLVVFCAGSIDQVGALFELKTGNNLQSGSETRFFRIIQTRIHKVEDKYEIRYAIRLREYSN